MKNLSSKTAFITGGSKGIGFAVAMALKNQGAQVVILGRSREKLNEAVTKLGNLGVLGIQVDVTDFMAVEKAVVQSVNKFGQIDIVFAAAGFFKFVSIDELSVELWDKTIATNLSGVFYTIKATLAQLKKSKGYFFAISSLMGINFNKDCSAHNASKFGVMGLAQAAMLDMREYGIKTSVLLPGSVATHFDNLTPKEGYEWKIQPEDIGQIVVDLLNMNSRTLPSKVEIRPSFPYKK